MHDPSKICVCNLRRLELVFTVKASNFGPHETNFGPFLEISVAYLGELCVKNEQNRVWYSTFSTTVIFKLFGRTRFDHKWAIRETVQRLYEVQS